MRVGMYELGVMTLVEMVSLGAGKKELLIKDLCRNTLLLFTAQLVNPI